MVAVKDTNSKDEQEDGSGKINTKVMAMVKMRAMTKTRWRISIL